MKKFAILGTLLSLVAVGCASEGDLPEVDCATVQVDSYAQVTGFAKCTGCHSTQVSGAARNSAPAGWNFDTYAGASHDPTQIVHEVYEGAMPPSGYPPLTAVEKDQIYAWGLCGAPQ
jgi:uncharacterized membrane protein